MKSALLGAVLAVGIYGSASAEDFAANRQKALDALVIEMGVTSRLIGQCERHLPAGAFDQWEASTMDKTGPGASTELAHTVRLFLRGQLHDGRTATKLDQAACGRLLDRQASRIDRAGELLASYNHAATSR